MIKVRVKINNRQKEKLPLKLGILVRRSCRAVLQSEGFSDNAEISVSFVSEEEIKVLNSAYRNKDSVTDVLSFPLGENGVYDENPENGYKLLGDIVICVKRAKEQAQAFGHSTEREFSFLTVHSMLHLLGYDHEKTEEETEMREKQSDIMLKLGVSRG